MFLDEFYILCKIALWILGVTMAVFALYTLTLFALAMYCYWKDDSSKEGEEEEQ